MNNKFNEFLSEEFNNIFKESGEFKAYDLGVAVGYLNLYNYIKKEKGIKFAKEVFDLVLKDTTERTYIYFKKLVEIND